MSDDSNKFKASIIIPTINNTKLVKDCITSLKNVTTGIDYEIIVVDDGSNQNIQNSLKKLSKQLNFQLICKSENTGFSTTINRGIQAASGKYIVLVNNDIIFIQHNWLEKMVKTTHQDPRIGIVGCRLLYPDNTIQHGGMYFNSDHNRCSHYYRNQPADYNPALNINKVPFVTGALMLIKKEVIDEIGLFDESIFASPEDVEYCLRAREARWIIMYCGQAKAIHLEGATRGTNPQNKIDKWHKKEMEDKKEFWNSVTIPPKEKFKTESLNLSIPFNNPQVIYVLPELGLTGGVKIILEQANRLAKRGYRVVIHCLKSNLDWFDLNVPIKFHKNYHELTTALKNFNCIKIATWWETAPVVFNSCNPKQGGQGIPVYFVQDMEDKFYPHSLNMQKKVKSTYQLPMLYLTGSEWIKEELETKYNQPTRNISYAIDLNIFTPQKRVIDYDCRRGIAYSKSDYYKQFDITKKAITQVTQEIEFVSLITFGSQFEVKLNNIPHLHFSKISDHKLAYLYNSSGIFIHNSKHEDFGFPILEAMACGTPVVTTEANGNLEYCQDEYNCLLAPPNNIPQLAAKIKQVLTNPDLAHHLAQNGVKTARDYNWKNTIDNLESFINQTYKKSESDDYKKVIKECLKK